MSTIKVNKIENTSTTNGGVAIDVDGHVTIDGQNFPTAGPLSNRNLIINGAMQVAQRGAGPVTVTVDGEYLIDRFKTYSSSFNTHSVDHSQDTDVPAGQGFQYSYKLKVSANAAATPTFGYTLIGYSFEGYDINQLEYGTANSKTVAVSFWVKSSVAGTYGFCLRNSLATRNYTGEYSIQAANTWEYKTFTISGSDSGTFETTNATGLEILMGIDVGSTFFGTANAWNNSNLFGTSGMTNTWSDTLNNEFYVTGLQVEVGTKSTPFEHRSYGDELQRCMRYFEKSFYTENDYQVITPGAVLGTSTSADLLGMIYYKVKKRAKPTITGSAAGTFRNNGAGVADEVATSVQYAMVSDINHRILTTSSTSKSSGNAGWISRENQETCFINYDAEL